MIQIKKIKNSIKQRVSMLTVIEVSIGAIIALVANYYNQESATYFRQDAVIAISLVLGFMLTLNRYFINSAIEEHSNNVKSELKSFNRYSQTLNENSYSELKEFIHLYAKIDPDFHMLRDRKMREIKTFFQNIADSHTTSILPTTEFYAILNGTLREFLSNKKVNANVGNIWSLSMMLNAEWDESQPEREFLKLNLAIAEKGIQFHRVFVFKKDDLDKVLNNTSIRQQIKAAKEYKNFDLKFIYYEDLSKFDKSLLSKLGDGFIVIADDKESLALLDKDIEGELRGTATKNKTTIHEMKANYELLNSCVVNFPPTTPALFSNTSDTLLLLNKKP